MESFKWENSGPYQIGHNKQLVILYVVIIKSAYCTAFYQSKDKYKFNEKLHAQ